MLKLGVDLISDLVRFYCILTSDPVFHIPEDQGNKAKGNDAVQHGCGDFYCNTSPPARRAGHPCHGERKPHEPRNKPEGPEKERDYEDSCYDQSKDAFRVNIAIRSDGYFFGTAARLRTAPELQD